MAASQRRVEGHLPRTRRGSAAPAASGAQGRRGRPLIDSHAHLADPAFDADREDVIARAREAGLRAVICIGESLASAARARELSSRHPGFLFWTAGVHPHDAASFVEDRDVPAIERAMADGAVAVGECGLDYHYDHSPRARQIAAFEAQLGIAARQERPVVVHTREAQQDTTALVRAAGMRGVRGVMHCFTGSVELARTALDAGWYVSFSGIITFRKWTDLELLRLVPAERLLVESDAPYLAPVPRRGKRNEPALVAFTLQRLAEVRGEPAEELARSCARNAAALFSLPHAPALAS